MTRKYLRPRKRIEKTTINWKGYCSECKFWELKMSKEEIEDTVKDLLNAGGYHVSKSLWGDYYYIKPRIKRSNCLCKKFNIIRSMEAIPCMLYQFLDRGKIDLLPKLLISRDQQGEQIYEKEK